MELVQLFENPNNNYSLWKYNYHEGTKYELYRVLLSKKKFTGLRFKDVCLILFHKTYNFLISLEVKIAGHLKVFVNPSNYIFEDMDHYGYVINKS